MLIIVWMVSSAFKWPFRFLLFPVVMGIPVFGMAAVELWFRPFEGGGSAGEKSFPSKETLNAFIPIIGFFLLVLLFGFPTSLPLFVPPEGAEQTVRRFALGECSPEAHLSEAQRCPACMCRPIAELSEESDSLGE